MRIPELDGVRDPAPAAVAHPLCYELRHDGFPGSRSHDRDTGRPPCAGGKVKPFFPS